MSFCSECESFLPLDVLSCPNCSAPRPPAKSVTCFWSADLGEPPAGPPIEAEDLLLVPTQGPGSPPQNSDLHALDPGVGGLQWIQSFEYALISGLAQFPESSELAGGLILIATSSTDLLRGEGALLALDATGAERWRWAPGAQRISAPTVVGDAVCFTSDAQTLVLLDLVTGSARSQIPLDVSASLAAPAVVGDVAYVPCRSPHLLAVGLEGTLRWRFDAVATPGAWLDQTPVVAGDLLFTSLGTGAVLALRVEDGSLAWQADVGPAGKRISPPVADGLRLYVGARDGLHALNLTDGHRDWTFPTPRRIVASPIVVGGVVYCTCHDHHLYALDAATGSELWRYQAERRIEVSPVVTEVYVLIVDRGGAVTAAARPLSAAEHESAGHWVEAASAYAALGQLVRAAELLESHAEPLKAAGLWQAADKLERAAEQFEVAGAWDRAVDLWERLGRQLKHAAALEGYARSLASAPHTDQERAAAWAIAALAFEIAGEMDRAAACQREESRFTRQPIITMKVEHEGLVLDAWSRLQFTVRNDGFGPARNLIIRARGEQFKGQLTATRQIITLRAGSEHTDRLDVRPLQHGDSVPLRVRVEYQDHSLQDHAYEQTLYIPVARTEAVRGAGQVIQVREDLAITPSPEAARLRQVLSTKFDLDEFRTLCADLGVNYYHLAGETLPGKARELVGHLQRRDALSLLYGWLERERPDIEI